MKAFLIFFTFTVINIVVSLPPDPTLYAYLQSLINPTGITDVGAMISQIPDDSHGLVILSPSSSRDFAYFTLNGTTAACDSQYSLSGGPGPALRQSGTCISQKDVSFLVECSNTTNTAGEQNWLYAIFNQTGTYFATYGSARAIFVPRELPTPPIPTAGSTTGQAVTGEQSNNSSQSSAQLVSDIPNLNWTDTGYSKDENTIILSDCPVFTDISLYLD